MFKNHNIDVLFVCLTNNIAAEVTNNGLKNGMHVFCETLWWWTEVNGQEAGASLKASYY